MSHDVQTINIPIQTIVLVDEILRPDTTRFHSASTPQHLIHITLSGEVKQSAGGQIERFRGGDVVWYHEAEPIAGEILRAPWHFITISFTAPTLSPPPADRRVLPGGLRTIPLAYQLVAAWRNQQRPALERSLICTAKLVELLLDFAPFTELTEPADVYPANARDRWWVLERLLRQRLDSSLSLADMANLAGMSPRTLNRTCKAATGSSPVHRLRELRMNHARGLVQHTDLPVTEIAFRIGYARVQEFSRDFKKRYHQTPREARATLPDYREIK